MNSQKKPPQEVLDILKNRNITYFDLSYYAWPEMFGSTSGPRGGIGGCAMTDFTIEAWVCDGSGPTFFTCAGMYSFDDELFEPFKKIKRWTHL